VTAPARSSSSRSRTRLPAPRPPRPPSASLKRISKHLGLDVAAVETTEIAGRRLIVAERYDRTVGADGAVERVHQEDFCQATGTPPDTKYEEDGGPSLRRIAGIVQSVATLDSLQRLAQAVALNVMLGNGDAHAKNLSLLHHRSGALSPAPLYDLMCTLYYGDDRLAMYVDSVQRSDRVREERIVNEIVRWGAPPTRTAEIVGDLLERAPAAIAAAREETDGVPDDLAATIERQVTRLRAPA